MVLKSAAKILDLDLWFSYNIEDVII
jgi:hypothetical protein